ncbi:MAG: CxxxxCH/CxxCH domain-containing protein, partial [Syntrophales bacterium]
KTASYLNNLTDKSAAVTANSLTKAGAGWTPDQWKGMILIPNVSYQSFNYRILSNTVDTITINTGGGDAINLTYIKPGQTFAIVYGKLVKEVVNGKSVRFFRQTGNKSSADGDATIDGICEVCHTKTQNPTNHDPRFRNTGSSDNHYAGESCKGCHTHTGGFKASCTACHGNPPVDTSSMVGFTNPSSTGSVTAGAHNAHVTTQSISCSGCHYNSVGSGSTHNSGNAVTIGFYNFSGGAQGGAYNGQSGVAYNATATSPATTTSSGGLKECSNSYCHGSTMAPNGGSDTTPVWDNSATGACGTCHGATAASPPSRGNHSIHTLAYLGGYNYSCSLCHKDPNSDASLHVNNKSEVVFSTDPKTTGGSYGGTQTMLDGYGTCTNIYCHSKVQSSPPGSPVDYDSPTWGSTLVAPHCSNNCHYSGHAAKLATGSHTKHFEYGTEPTCQRCHNYYNKDRCAGCHSPEPTLKPRDKHANGSIDVAFAPIYGGSAGTYSGAPTPGDAYGSCSNTYCHGKYNGSGKNATPAWGNASSAACGTCHGASNTSQTTSGSHEKHVTATKLLKGVNQYTYNREYACTLCHKDIVGGSGPSSYTISDKIKHVSGKVDWKFDIADSRVSGTSTYSIASGTAVPSDGTTPRAYGTCSNVYCHSNVQPNGGVGAPSSYDTPNWGTTINCDKCHAPADMTYFHGTTIASGSHSQHMAYTFNSYKINRCTLCHKWNSAAAGIFDGSTCTNQCHSTSEKTLHADGSINVMFDTYFGSGVYNGASAPGDGYSNCSNTYCHSDGTSVSTDSIPNNTSANWGSGALACSACHGNPPNYTSGSPKTNSHAIHVAHFGCHYCHADTTSDGVTITNKTNHVNKAYNVSPTAGLTWQTNVPQITISSSFTYTYNSTGGTCANIACHVHPGGQNATWGDKGAIMCAKCHPGFFP